MMSWPSAVVSAVWTKTPLYRQMEIRPGITAVIGSGGKTSLIARLCKELPGTVIVCTSTHIFPAEGMLLVTGVLESLPADRICVGTPAENGKLTAPLQSFAELAGLADYVLVEADGSRGLPLKAHLPHEPVIPEGAAQVIQVVGLSGMGKPIKKAAHRPEYYAEICGCELWEIATPERMARVLNTEALADRYVLNQADDPEDEKFGRTLAALLPKPAILTKLKNEE